MIKGLVNYDGKDIKIGDPGVQLKYQLLNDKEFAASLAGRIGFNSSSSTTYTVYAVPSFQTQFAQFDLTIGSSFMKKELEYKNLYFYAFALSPKFDLPLGIFGEIFGELFSGSTWILE